MMVLHSVLTLATVALVGCGSSGSSELFEPRDTSTSGGNAGASVTTGGRGGSGSGGTVAHTGGSGLASGGAAAAGDAGACLDGLTEICSCPSGSLASRLCEAGRWSDCRGCDGGAICSDGDTQPCPCIGGGSGVQTCQDGAFGVCDGCANADPGSGCPAPYYCEQSVFGPYCADPSLNGAPPWCTIPDLRCDHVGGGVCAPSMLGAYCLKSCTP
jgi:hypothetical protein